MSKAYDVQDIIDGINDAQQVLDDPYIDNQIRAFYESELAHYQSLLNRFTYNTNTGTWHIRTDIKVNVPLF